MGSEKKKMVHKTCSRRLSSTKDTFTSMLGEVMITEREKTTGLGECHSFLRKNAHSGPIPTTGSLRRARPRRGNPQHFVRQHRGMVKQLWRVILADTEAHRPNAKNAKIPKNISEHRTSIMPKCPSAYLHTTSYLARFLAKIRNRFKRATIRAYATMKAITPADFGVNCSLLVLHPCSPEDGLFLAPNCETMRATPAFRNNAPEHTNNHQSYKQTNNPSGYTGPNSQVLTHKMSSWNLLGMAPQKITTASTPSLQDTPEGPHEDLPTGNQDTLPQQATPRSNAIAFLGNWRRSHALKMRLTDAMRKKAHNQRHASFKKWEDYTRPTTTTGNLAPRTVHTARTEALRQWQCLPTINDKRHNTKHLADAVTARLNTQTKTMVLNHWRQHAQDTSDAGRPHVQLFLRGLADETLTIIVPVPVTRRHLHRIIAKKTSVPPQEQLLGSMHHYADAQNADLFYMEKYKTLHLSLRLNGGSGSSRPPKHTKLPTHQAEKFHIYINGPDQHHNAMRVLPSDKIHQVKKLLEDRVGLHPSSQTIFFRGAQLDDFLTLQDCEITQGATLQLLLATPPMTCEWHHKCRSPEHLRQKFDPDAKQWIWVCCPGSICRVEGPSQTASGPPPMPLHITQ